MPAEPIEHSTPADLPPRAAGLRFFDTFLQEKNIKWMLGLGGLILFASSLMLVTSHWQDYTPLWKSLVVMGYTAILYVLGEIAYQQLGLRRTGTSLFATTVLLIPISFLAVRTVNAPGLEAGHVAGIIGLLLANTLFAAFAGRRILRHFLRQDQFTFLLSYLTLSLSGAIVPGLPQKFAIPAALFLWMVFAAGTIKVNRHVFWLGEEHRLPRIFGFFPILLLGIQFLTLFAFLAPGVPLPWMGFGLVLTAIPVLMTADALAQVFEQRTGNLVRPLPWSLVLPTLVGTVLCFAGLCLSWTGFPATFAAVPTALLTAAIFAMVARRTQQAGFVFAMWAGVVLAYQASPVFFREFARTVVHQGANAVSESRLPFAFYGLTYLPLLIAATLFAVVCRRRGNEIFARPTRSFAIFLTSVLWLMSFTHAKAVFPVGLATLGMFTLQMFAFRLPSLRFGLVAAWISTSWGLTPFLVQVLGWNVGPETFLGVMSLSTALLLLPDRFLSRVTVNDHDVLNRPSPYAIGDLASLLMTAMLALVWLELWAKLPEGLNPWSSGLMVVVLMLLHAMRWCRVELSAIAILFAGLYGVLIAHAAGVSEMVIVSQGILIAGGLWCLAIGLNRVPELRISRAFGKAAEHLAGCALIAGLFGYSLLGFVNIMAGYPGEFWWISTLVPVAWAFDASKRWRAEVWATFGCIAILGLTGAASLTVLGRDAGWTWLPLIWSLVGLISVPLIPRPFQWIPKTNAGEDQALSATQSYILMPVGRFAILLFGILAVGTLPFFSIPARLASLVSVACLFWLAGGWQNTWLRHLALSLLNWHALSGVIQIAVPGAEYCWELNRAAWIHVSLPLALAAAFSRAGWNLSSRQSDAGLGEWISFHRLLLLGVACLGMFWSLNFLPLGLSLGQVLMAVGTFALLASDQLWQAVKSQEEAHVWTAEGIIVLCLGYLLRFDVIHFGSGLSMYAVLLTGWAAWIIGHLASTARTLAGAFPTDVRHKFRSAGGDGGRGHCAAFHCAQFAVAGDE